MADRFSPVAITGMGLVCSIAHTIPEFTNAILEGRHGMTNLPVDKDQSVRIGALIKDFDWKGWIESLKSSEPALSARARKVLNNTTESTRLSAYAATQAVRDAGLGERNSGTNLALSSPEAIWRKTISCRTGIDFGRLDGRILDMLSLFSIPIRWAASAKSFRSAVPVAPSAPLPRAAMPLFFRRSTGFVAGSCGDVWSSGRAWSLPNWSWRRSPFSEPPVPAVCKMTRRRACRPFDQGHEGFVWGQGAGCVVLESLESDRWPPGSG